MSSPTGPTPPPPQQYSSPEPATIAPTGPGLTEPQRLINTFIAPSKTFEDLKRNDSWWAPWLISAVFALIFSIVAVQKIDMVRFVQQQIEKSPSAQRRMEQATPAQREQGMALQATITKGAFYAVPVFALIGGLIIAAILMAVFNFVLGAEVPFSRALAVTFYAGLTGIIRSILLTVSLLASNDPNTIDISGNPMPTNPAFFMDPMGNKFLYSLLGNIDIFAIWYVLLLGIGFATASSRKISVSSGIAAAFVCYGILALAGAAWKVAF
jgi:hypothetical protein